MLVSVPLINLPLIRLPFLNSKESARAATAATHSATIAPQICFAFITSSPVHSCVAFRPGSCLFAASGRKVLQQFLRALIEPLLVFLLFFARFNRMLGSAYPNQLLCSGVIHTNDESPDVNG